MGEAKRRQKALGEKYGQEERILSWVPITKNQADLFVEWTTRGAWFGITLMIIAWVTIRFIGPAFGWWQLAD